MIDSEATKFLGSSVIHLLVSIFLANVCYLNHLEFLGLYFSIGILTWLILIVLRTTYNTWIGVWLGHNTDLKRMGSWGVVTGATDGIGLTYCQQLAKMGINVVLISRSLEKLQKCAKLLESEFGVDTMTIQLDFSEGIKAYEILEALLRGMDIGILINNVGMTYPTPSHFHEIATPKFISDIINLNVVAVTMMSRIVILGMLERKKGVVVNVGSIGSCIFSPWFALYGATKAYMENLTDDLALEYKDSGVIFQYQSPGYVSTKLSRFKTSIAVPSPEDYAQCGIRSIGLQQKTSVWFIHRFFNGVLQINRTLNPEGVAEYTRSVMRTFWLFARRREMEKLHGVHCHTIA